jgi:GH25 family lysozyme M1 (1,4-beta-N-acetylmuramidase)
VTGEQFVDISHHQGGVDLAVYAGAGYERIAIKATGGALDGGLYTDPLFSTRWVQSGELGLARVGYHFARNNNPGSVEYDHFRRITERAGGFGERDLPCYDTEDDRSPQLRRLARQRTIEFTHYAAARGAPRGLIYSYAGYLAAAGITAADVPPGWRLLWLADPTPGQPDSQIEVPPGWTRDQVAARQYTDHADVPGIPHTDANRVLHNWLGDTMDQATFTRLLRAALADPEIHDDLRTVAQEAIKTQTARTSWYPIRNQRGTVYLVIPFTGGLCRVGIRNPAELAAFGYSPSQSTLVSDSHPIWQLPLKSFAELAAAAGIRPVDAAIDTAHVTPSGQVQDLTTGEWHQAGDQ